MPVISSAKDGGFSGYPRKISELQDDLKQEAQRARERDREREGIASEALERELKRNHEESLKATEKSRQANAEAAERVKREARAEVDDLKKQLYDKQGKTMTEDVERERRLARNAIDETEKRHAEELRRQNHAQDVRLKDLSESQADRVSRELASERESRKNEVALLNDRYRQLEKAQSQRGDADIEAKGQIFRDLENQLRAEGRNRDRGYETQIKDLKEQNDRLDSNYGAKIKEIVQGKEEEKAKLLSQARKEGDLDRSTLKKQFDTSRVSLEKRNRENSTAYDKALEERNRLNQENLGETLGKMQDTHRKDTENLSRRMTNENRRLEDEVHYLKHTPNPTAFSDEARRNVEKNWVDNYNKLFTEEQGRNLKSQEQMHRRFNQRYSDEKLAYDRKHASTIRNFETQKQADLNHFHEGMIESHDMKDKALKSQERIHNQELETRDRRNVDSVDKLRRQYDEQIETLRNNAAAALQAERMDGEFALRMQHRALTFRQNELIREYEKKLADQKEELVGIAEQTRAQADKAVRDAERDRNRALDEQKKVYEQKIAVIEAQHKERDRIAEQNHLEEIEKVKRSNAILVQKKS